nr:hypothetical protein [Streptomyces cellulosae]
MSETKIETDRRQIHERMARLRREIAQLKTGRDVKREERRRNFSGSHLTLRDGRVAEFSGG